MFLRATCPLGTCSAPSIWMKFSSEKAFTNAGNSVWRKPFTNEYKPTPINYNITTGKTIPWPFWLPFRAGLGSELLYSSWKRSDDSKPREKDFFKHSVVEFKFAGTNEKAVLSISFVSSFIRIALQSFFNGLRNIRSGWFSCTQRNCTQFVNLTNLQVVKDRLTFK